MANMSEYMREYMAKRPLWEVVAVMRAERPHASKVAKIGVDVEQRTRGVRISHKDAGARFESFRCYCSLHCWQVAERLCNGL